MGEAGYRGYVGDCRLEGTVITISVDLESNLSREFVS
jgi:hypothetical protein